MSGHIDKAYRPLVKELMKQGCEVRKGGKHPKLYDSNGKFVSPLPTSSGDQKAIRAFRTQLRHRGLLP